LSRVRVLIPAAAVLLPSACSSGAPRDDASNAAPVVPAGLTVTALAGGNGVLDVIALTLREGQDGTELYAAVRNGGDVPACDAALSVELFDQSQTSVAAGIGALFTRRFYRLSDGSGAVAACVGPGDVAMAALTDLPSEVPIEDVGYIVYRCPYFALDVVPIRGLAVGPVTRVARDGTTAYAGTLFNELDVAVSHPSVTVFPTNDVGRPLGATTGSGTISIPPGGSWTFETNAAETSAADYAAYPAGSFAN
jgi:hypothetical protein